MDRGADRAPDWQSFRRQPIAAPPTAAACQGFDAPPGGSIRAGAQGRGSDLASGIPGPGHDSYLQRKGVGAHGLRCDSAGNLIVPLRDIAGALHTVEFIAGDGTKRYLWGGEKAGHFCTIGGPLDGSGAFLICEGWATGASLHEATRLPVVAAMDAGNLGPVAEQLRRSYPDAAITIVADNDDDKPGAG